MRVHGSAAPHPRAWDPPRAAGGKPGAHLPLPNLFTFTYLFPPRPRRYEDRRHFRGISALRLGEAGTIRGQIVAVGGKGDKHHTKSGCELIVDYGTARLPFPWGNLPFLEKYFQKGDQDLFSGKVEELKTRTIDH